MNNFHPGLDPAGEDYKNQHQEFCRFLAHWEGLCEYFPAPPRPYAVRKYKPMNKDRVRAYLTSLGSQEKVRVFDIAVACDITALLLFDFLEDRGVIGINGQVSVARFLEVL